MACGSPSHALVGLLEGVAYPSRVRLDEKAKENLEAAERLLPDEAGREGLLNAAVSRIYYAAYLAVADRALQHGIAFTGQRSSYFRHDSLPGDARSWGILDDDGVEDLEDLYALRITADYCEDQVELDQASDGYDAAVRLVDKLLGNAT
jgi:uncharacterized protein (UPF0332 family)